MNQIQLRKLIISYLKKKNGKWKKYSKTPRNLEEIIEPDQLQDCKK